MRNTIYLSFCLLFGFGLQAQTQTKVNNQLNTWTVGVNMGHLYDLLITSKDGSQASGDLKGLNGDKTEFDFGYGLFVEKQFNPLFGLQLGLNGGNLTGANELEYYEGSFSDINLNMTFNFSNLGLNNMNSPWNFYSRMGLGLLTYSSERFLNFDDASNNAEENSVLSTNLGLGLRYQFNSKWRAEFQGNYQAVFNDGFDGWDYGSGADQFLYTSIGIAYTLGNKERPSMEQVNFFSDEYLSISSQNIQVASVQDTGLIKDLETKLKEEELKSEVQQKQINQQNNSLEKQEIRLRELENQNQNQNQKQAVSMNRSLFFASKSSKLSKAAKEELTSLSILLVKNAQLKVRITACADKYGQEDYNITLRNNRAESVENFLMETLGVSAERIERTSNTQLINGDSMQSLNRRVDIELVN